MHVERSSGIKEIQTKLNYSSDLFIPVTFSLCIASIGLSNFPLRNTDYTMAPD